MIENKFPVFSFRLTVTLTVGLGTFQKYFDGFLGFFQDLCEFVRHCSKRHIFLCLLFILLTITGRNEALKA